MKSTTFYILLSIWIFNIAAPSALTLLNSSDASVVFTIADKEQQEQGEKDTCEEKILAFSQYRFATSSFSVEYLPIDQYLLGNSKHILEIPIPPPEHSV